MPRPYPATRRVAHRPEAMPRSHDEYGGVKPSNCRSEVRGFALDQSYPNPTLGFYWCEAWAFEGPSWSGAQPDAKHCFARRGRADRMSALGDVSGTAHRQDATNSNQSKR